MEGPPGLTLGRAGRRYWRPLVVTAYAVIDSTAMSAAMGCIAGARQMTMIAINHTCRRRRAALTLVEHDCSPC